MVAESAPSRAALASAVAFALYRLLKVTFALQLSDMLIGRDSIIKTLFCLAWLCSLQTGLGLESEKLPVKTGGVRLGAREVANHYH